MTTAIEEVVALRRRVDELETENRWLRDRLAPASDTFRSLGLSLQERRILARLFDASPATVKREQLAELLGDRVGVDNLASPMGALAVEIHKIRKKLAKHGVEVMNDYGVGFYINEGGRVRLEEKIGMPNALDA